MTSKECDRRVPLFDAWRIFAIALVVGVHLLQKGGHPFGRMFGPEGFYRVTLGGVGVTLLLILSGVVLEYSYRNTTIGWRRFMWRRVCHLYPVYWLSVIAAVGVFGRRPPEPLSPLEWVADMAGILAAFGQVWGDLILPTSWFLAVIIPLYAVYLPVSALLARNPTLGILVMLAISVAARLFVGEHLPGDRGNDWFVLARLFEFSLGIWLVQRESVVHRMRSSMFRLPDSGRVFLTWAASISFPVYLVHWSTERWAVIDGLPIASYLVAYFIVTVVAATIIQAVGARMERTLRALA